jgi:hypothetical protein
MSNQPTKQFKVLKAQNFGAWATKYIVEHKGKEYECIRNSGTPTLKGKRLSEKLLFDLDETLEKHFWDNIYPNKKNRN